MRVAFVEWPEALRPDTAAWDEIIDQVVASRAELLVTNELPFGRWIAGRATFDEATAQESVDIHEAGRRASQNSGFQPCCLLVQSGMRGAC